MQIKGALLEGGFESKIMIEAVVHRHLQFHGTCTAWIDIAFNNFGCMAMLCMHIQGAISCNFCI